MLPNPASISNAVVGTLSKTFWVPSSTHQKHFLGNSGKKMSANVISTTGMTNGKETQRFKLHLELTADSFTINPRRFSGMSKHSRKTFNISSKMHVQMSWWSQEDWCGGEPHFYSNQRGIPTIFLKDSCCVLCQSSGLLCTPSSIRKCSVSPTLPAHMPMSVAAHLKRQNGWILSCFNVITAWVNAVSTCDVERLHWEQCGQAESETDTELNRAKLRLAPNPCSVSLSACIGEGQTRAPLGPSSWSRGSSVGQKAFRALLSFICNNEQD